jgi:hypothetical protein
LYHEDCRSHAVFSQLGGTLAGPVCLSDTAEAAQKDRERMQPVYIFYSRESKWKSWLMMSLF